jgi:hypothetical protein
MAGAAQEAAALQVQGVLPQWLQRAAFPVQGLLQPFHAALQLLSASQVQGVLPQRLQRAAGAASRHRLLPVSQPVWQPSQVRRQLLCPLCALRSQWFQSVPLSLQGAQASTARKAEAVCAASQMTVSLFRITILPFIRGGRQENVPALHPMPKKERGAKTGSKNPSPRQPTHRGANHYASTIPA